MMMLTQDFVESLLDGAIMIAKYSGRDTVSYDDIDQYLSISLNLFVLFIANAWKLHANKHRYF